MNGARPLRISAEAGDPPEAARGERAPLPHSAAGAPPRVVVLAPLGRDAQLLAESVRENGGDCRICRQLDEFIAVVQADAADLLLVTDVALGAHGHDRLVDTLDARERGDLLPVVLLAHATGFPQPLSRRGGVLVIPMPTRKRLLASAIRSALDTRARVLELRSRERDLAEKHAQLEVLAAELQAHNLELAQATRTQTRFIANTSHELRTPLNALMGYLELLDLDELTERQKGYIARIRIGTNHLLYLIQEILDVAKAKAGALQVEQALVELMPIVKKAAALVAHQAEGKGLRLAIELPAQPLPPVRGNSQRIAQVLLNLLSNAVKFTDAGTITVRFETRQEGMIAVLVQDSGIGIADDDVQKLFTEFYRVDDSSTSRHGGSGLGLAISKQLAILMGGDLCVTSRPGQGSTFVLTLTTSL